MSAVSHQLPQTSSVPVRGEPLALELVNTTFVEGGVRGQVVDVLSEPAQLDQWLGEHAEAFSPALREAVTAARSSQEHLTAFRRLRQALRDCLGAVTADETPETTSMTVVNEFAQDAAHWLGLAAGDPVIAVRHWRVADQMRVAAGEVAIAGAELMAGPMCSDLRACPAPGCILYFLKNHPRREWCSPACGNRVRVARFSRRQRPETGTGTSSG